MLAKLLAEDWKKGRAYFLQVMEKHDWKYARAYRELELSDKDSVYYYTYKLGLRQYITDQRNALKARRKSELRILSSKEFRAMFGNCGE